MDDWGFKNLREEKNIVVSCREKNIKEYRNYKNVLNGYLKN